MTASPRRTLPVRGWFALAALTTFAMIVIGVLASVVLFGVADLSSQDRVASAEGLLRDGTDRWRDAAWREVTAARLAADDVSFALRSEEHTSELQSLMRISYAVFCLKKQKNEAETKENI